MVPDCDICNGNADSEFKRVEVWRNERWRLTTSTFKLVRGFCYLEPVRHIEDITQLDGLEASEFGMMLAKATSALKAVTGAKLIYLYIYGDHIPHLHVHLAPHKPGDVYADDVLRSDVKADETLLPPVEINPFVKELRANLDKLPQS